MPSLRFVGALLLLGSLSGTARAQFSKTITVNPNVTVNAVTTWYYANCTTVLGVGSYTRLVAPMHGTVTFGQISAPLPGCPPGSPSLPAEAAFYTWTDTPPIAPPSSDFFELLYTAPDGETEVIDVTVDLPVCAITSETLATVPGVNNFSRTSVGIGESVLLTTSIPVTWSISSGAGSLAGSTVATTERDFPGQIGFPAGFPSTQCAADSSLSGTAAQSCFIAPYSNSSTVVTTTGGGSTCSTTITTVQPTGLIYQRLEYPPGNPDYHFETHALDYVIGMTGAAFVTPGNVSFVNIRISELDDKHPHFDPNYNLLFNVGGTNAWLVGCDKILDNTYGQDPDPKQSYWEFADNLGAGGHATEFSLVQTQWTPGYIGIVDGYEYTKGQIAALSVNGTFVPSQGPAATLTLPADAPDFKRWIVGNRFLCPAQVEAQPQIQLIH